MSARRHIRGGPDPLRGICSLLAAGLLGLVLFLTDGHYSRTGLILLTMVACLALLAVVARSPYRPGPISRGLLTGAVAVVAAGQVTLLLQRPLGIYDRASSLAALHVPLLVAASVVTGALLVASGEVRRRVLVPLLLGLSLLVGVCVIEASPDPWIDVFVFHQDAIDALLAGRNPYAINFPNLYPDLPYYAPELVENGRTTFGYPYPPLSLLLAVPGKVVFGDYRYSLLAAMIGAAALLAYTTPGRWGALAAAILLLTPRGWFVLEQGWTEPFVLLFAAATLFAAGRAPWLVPWLLGLLLASKQYALLAIPAGVLLLPRPWTAGRLGRAACVTALVASAVTLPFSLASPHAFFHSTIGMHLAQPFRADSLNFLAPLARMTGRPVSTWPGPLLAVGAMALGLWRGKRSSSGFAATSVLTMLLFFGFSKQAFANYYWLVIGLTACAFASVGWPEESEARHRGEETRA